MTVAAALPDRLLDRCQEDPTYFHRVVLGRRSTAAQRRLRRAVREHRRVHVRSGNSAGKTNELAALAIEWLICNPYGRVICTGPAFHQVRRGLWTELRKLHRGAKFKLGGVCGASSWTIRDGWDAAVISVENISAIQGARGSKCLVIIDEAQGVTSMELWTALESLMTATGSRMIASGNPLFTTGRFAELPSSPEWHCIRIDSFEHPNVVCGREVIPGAVTREWIEEKRREWGEESPEWTARVLGEFPRGGTKQLIGLGDLEACEDIETGVDEEPRIALDVARYGMDRTVLGVFDRTRTLVEVESWAGQNLMSTVGLALDAWNRHGGIVRVDVCGMGAGVVDRLLEQGVPVDPVDFGERPQGDWLGSLPGDTKFLNRRAELHWVTRELVRARTVCIPKRFSAVRADLLAITYDHKSDGRLYVEDKEKIRKAIGRSPDHGDMVHIAMSNAGAGVGVW